MGPNLLDVTHRRDKEWLRRWLLEPDVVLNEGDPIAIQLRKEYNDVPMPNLGLMKSEASMLVDFLEVEGRRVAKVEGNAILSELRHKPVMECCQKDELGTLKDEPEQSAQAGDSRETGPTGLGPRTLPSLLMGGFFTVLAMLIGRKKRV